MIEGVTFSASGAVLVSAVESGTVASGKVTISGTPKTGEPIKIIKSDGTQVDGTYATGQVSATGLTDGTIATVIYKKEATGTTLTVNAGTFSSGYEVEYHTIAYDVTTLAVKADVYFKFPTVQANDDFDLSFENGKAQSPETSFTVIAQSNGDLFTYSVVPRV